MVAIAVAAPTASITALADSTVSVNKIEPSDGDPGSRFGYGVDTAGDLIVVAAPFEAPAGAAYVYELQGATWQAAKLIPSDGAAGHDFAGAGAVATDGRRVAIGAPGAGTVYVYALADGGGWTETKLTSSSADAADGFGIAVDIDGPRVVVGAHLSDSAGLNHGAVHVFDESPPDTWTERVLVRDAPGDGQDQLGRVIAASGGVVVASGFGGPTIFEETGPEQWLETTPEISGSSRLGVSVAAAGDRVAIGDSGGFGQVPDSVHVGTRGEPGEWAFERIDTTDPDASGFASAVDLAGDSVLVAAPDSYIDGVWGVGAVYLYEPDGGGYTETRHEAYDGVAADSFGHAIAASAERLIVAAPNHDGSSADWTRDSGAVYVFEEGSPDWTPPTLVQPRLTIASLRQTPVEYSPRVVDNRDPQPNISCSPPSGAVFSHGRTDVECSAVDNAGLRTTIAFSVDVIVDEASLTVPGWELALDGNLLALGREVAGLWTVSAFEHRNERWMETPLIVLDHGSWSDWSGLEVAVSGRTIAVGDHERIGGGIVYIFEPDGDGGWLQIELQPAAAEVPNDYGHSVSISEDTLVVGDPRHGLVYVYERTENGWAESRQLTEPGEGFGYGHSVSVDDGRIVVGSPWSNSIAGAVYMYDSTGTAKFQATDSAPGDAFGGSVAVSADRIVVGTRYDDEEESRTAEKAYIYELSGRDWIETILRPTDATRRDLFGWTVAVSGDLVAVNAPEQHRPPDNAYEGAVYYWLPDRNGGWDEGKLRASGDSKLFGNSIAVSGSRIAAYGNHELTYIFEVWLGTRCDGQSPTIVGTAGNDELLGTNQRDVIIAGAGNDVVRGYRGGDVICAGSGDDTVYGGGGNDHLFGEGGADSIRGGTGHDQISGGPGHDTLHGLNGNDQLFGNSGNDTLIGYRGDDTLSGGPGRDVLRGHAGDDILYGRAGADELFGGSDNDFLDGGRGSDIGNGGSGNDECVHNEVETSCELELRAHVHVSLTARRWELLVA